MEVILKNVKERHMKLINALADTLGLAVERQQQESNVSFFGKSFERREGDIDRRDDINFMIDEIDKQWE